MKISTPQSHQAGGVFLIVMVTTAILSFICLGSYLSMASTQHRTVMRSLAWNTAMPLAEAGVEEALSHITKNTNSFAADGWTVQGTNIFGKRRTLSTGYYTVSLSGTMGSLITIQSTGYALIQGTNYISRTVKVIAQSSSAQPRMVGMVAKNGITFGGDFGADSYDSTNSAFNTNGRYDPAKASDQARVATPNGFTMGGHSHIYGFVQTSPGFTVSTGGGATVGDMSWVGGKNKGIEQFPTNHFSDNFTSPIPDVQAPFTSAAAPSSGTVSNTSYNYVLNGGNYMSTNLAGGGNGTSMIVTAPSVLVVTGAVSLASVVFAPGATLDLYIATPSISFCPTIEGLTAAQAVTPVQFRVWGLPSCTSMDMTGGKSFTGVIYAPEANLHAGGNAAFYGAFTSSTFDCHGTFDFHYDVATAGYITGGTSFAVISWAEL